MNGFKVEEKPSASILDQIGNNPKYLLKSLPISKKVVFTVDDFHELISIVSEHVDKDTSKKGLFKDKFIHKEVLRPSKIYHMLASRACRQSIMIGRALDNKLMQKVVSNLATLQSPWNCPHGRPTMRYLRRLEHAEVKER